LGDTMPYTSIDLFAGFDIYRPSSAGTYSMLEGIIINEIKGLPVALERLSYKAGATAKVVDLENFLRGNKFSCNTQSRFQEAFNIFGSDKAGKHDYYRLYSGVLESCNEITKIFEIGLGTNNTDTPSHMGKEGKPGASLRAWAHLFPEASIYGADVDRRILFEDERIKTFFVNQQDYATFNELSIGDSFDLMIDDGLHSPLANINSLCFFMDKIKKGGFIVIEDIPGVAYPIWRAVKMIIANEFACEIVKCKSGSCFVAKRKT
jgi:hypothetical protein